MAWKIPLRQRIAGNSVTVAHLFDRLKNAPRKRVCVGELLVLRREMSRQHNVHTGIQKRLSRRSQDGVLGPELAAKDIEGVLQPRHQHSTGHRAHIRYKEKPIH